MIQASGRAWDTGVYYITGNERSVSPPEPCLKCRYSFVCPALGPGCSLILAGRFGHSPVGVFLHVVDMELSLPDVQLVSIFLLT